MGVIVGTVSTFPTVTPNKLQAVKILEESAEVYSAWEDWKRTEDPELVPFVMDEIADAITALCNLAASFGVHDLSYVMDACEERNRERGRL